VVAGIVSNLPENCLKVIVVWWVMKNFLARPFAFIE